MKKVELKINHLNKNSNNYIKDYLQILGIKEDDVDSFIKQPRNTDEENPLNLCNMKRAVETTMELMKNNNTKVFVQIDSDTDGYTSSAILINYLRRRFPNSSIQWRLHHGKEHGVIVDTVPSDANLIFIPDAGSNQFNEHQKLFELGKTVIILDHHEVSDLEALKSTPAIIVNNQLSENFSNKNLSGAGVVYKFIKMMDKMYFPNQPIYQDYGDLAAIGIIADAMNMTTLDNNYIAWWGLSHIHSNFIKALALKQSRGIKNPSSLTKIDVAFYIAPVINGVIRSGAPEDKEMVFRALTEENNTEEFEHVWRGKTTIETLYECAARMAANAKSRQDASKKKAFEWLCKEIRNKDLDKHNIIIITLDEQQSKNVSANITGLIAMELVKEFNKPCLVLRKTTTDDGIEVYGGSGRNGNFYNLPDLKAALTNAGGYYQEGHANAFGSFLKPDQIEEVRQYFDTHYNSDEFNDTVYEVDYWFHTGESIDAAMLMEIAEYEWLWGNSIPAPTIAIDANFTASQVITMGQNNDSLRLVLDGISCVAFKNPELINELKKVQNGHITIVGRPQINEWMGNRSVQMIINDIAITSVGNSQIDLSNLI